MSKNTKILFTDLDGTLLMDNHQISDTNRRAVKEALAKGCRIVITTGRPIASAKQLAEALELTQEGCYVIASNGALLYDSFQDKILKECTFPKKYLRPLFESAYEEGLHIHTYSRTNVLSERDTPEIRWYEQAIQVPALIVDDAAAYLSYDPVKAILINKENHEKLVYFRQKMEPWIQGKMTSIFSSRIMLEYCPLGVSKGSALKELCRLLQIPIENSIAAGDAENDISMLDAAHIGCVLCNGSDETKEHADYITKKNNNEDGFAEIIRTFVL